MIDYHTSGTERQLAEITQGAAGKSNSYKSPDCHREPLFKRRGGPVIALMDRFGRWRSLAMTGDLRHRKPLYRSEAIHFFTRTILWIAAYSAAKQ
jgi:hypothetical protein